MKPKFRIFITLLTAICLAAAAVIPVGAVTLSEGTHARWVDRLKLPDYGRAFYDWLVENSNGDGADDALIDPTMAMRTGDGSYAYRLTTLSGTVPFETSLSSKDSGFSAAANAALSAAVNPQIDGIMKCAQAALDAFDHDHPEVFWLGGTYKMGTGRYSYAIKGNGSSYILDYRDVPVYVFIKTGDFDMRLPNYRSASVIRAAIAERDRCVSGIIGTLTAATAAGKLDQLNDWLTAHNAYNVNVAAADERAWESLSALNGSAATDADAPICEGYARAFKVLCDAIGIPCVLVSGYTSSDGQNNVDHMWNMVQMEDGNWYLVDVTWNDPVIKGRTGAVSGYENDDYLLVGSEDAPKHRMNNSVSRDGIAFANQPPLSAVRYNESTAAAVAAERSALLRNGIRSLLEQYGAYGKNAQALASRISLWRQAIGQMR